MTSPAAAAAAAATPSHRPPTPCFPFFFPCLWCYDLHLRQWLSDCWDGKRRALGGGSGGNDRVKPWRHHRIRQDPRHTGHINLGELLAARTIINIFGNGNVRFILHVACAYPGMSRDLVGINSRITPLKKSSVNGGVGHQGPCCFVQVRRSCRRGGEQLRRRSQGLLEAVVAQLAAEAANLSVGATAPHTGDQDRG